MLNLSTSILFATATALTFSSAAFARHYDGPAVDVNFIHQKPSKYAECDKYLNDTNARRFAACEFGRDEAERMAERFGGGNGRLQGFYRGYAWGLHKMTRAFQNDPIEMEAGERLIDSVGQYLEAGIRAGQELGSREGSSMGRSDAINRFLNVVDTGAEPDSELRIPETYYEGEDDAYRRHVGPIPTPQRLMKEEMDLGMLPVYDSWDAVYLGEKEPLSVWDLWFANGTYVFEKSRWYDEDLAMRVWLQRPIDTKPKYENLNNPPLLDPATGQMIDLQAVFKSAFKKSYEYYVAYFFSQRFFENMDMGQFAGEKVGEQLGKRLAQYLGLERAFNRSFKESSASSYNEAFSTSYANIFSGTFLDYLNNPKLSLEFESIRGADDDGIIQPGEAFSAVFTIRNVGGAGSPLTARIAGDVIEGKTRTFEIARLSSSRFVAENIGRVNPRLRPREQARLVLDVNGMQDTIGQTVQRMIELTGSNYRLDVVGGRGAIYVTGRNVATIRTPSDVSAVLRLNNVDVNRVEAGVIQAGSTFDLALPFASVDPLSLIRGEIQAKIVVSMGPQVLDEFTLDLNVENRDLELVRYYNQLLNGRGYVPQYTGSEERTSAVQNMIVETNERETRQWRRGGRSTNFWKYAPSKTIMGKLVAEYRATSQSTAAVERYNAMARVLAPARKNLRMFIFKGSKRKHYERLVRQLSTTGRPW